MTLSTRVLHCLSLTAALPALALLAGTASAQEGQLKPIEPKLQLRKANKMPDRKQFALPGGSVPIVPPPAPPEGAVNNPTPTPDEPAKPRTKRKDEDITIHAPGEGSVQAFGDIKTAKGQRCIPLKPTEKITFDFKGDILELVTTISKTTCKNFILTSKVRSQKFEIVSPTPITVDEAWRAFLSALEANEFTIIQVGHYYKIIQAVDATRAPVPIHEESQDYQINDAMITKIWKMKHASDINALVNYLNIFKSGKGQIHPYAPTNTIIATDFGTSMARIERVLKEIDQPGALEQVHVISVEFAAASEIAEKLTQVFEPQKVPPGGIRPPGQIRMKSSKPPESPGGMISPEAVPTGTPGQTGNPEEDDVAVSKILADDRTNKLIIIATDRSFHQIMSLKRELDVPSEGGDSQIQVVHLRHADAEELATTLSALAQGRPVSSKGKGAPGGQPNRPGVVPPGTPPGVPPAGGGAGLIQGEVKVTANKATNSVIITASKGDYSSLRRVIDRLDVARFQVFVEAVIMEVSVKRDRTLGLTWHGGIAQTIDGKQVPIIFGNEPTQSFSSLALSANPLGLAQLLGFAGVVRGNTLPGTETIIQGGIPAIGVVIQALQSTNNVNVISTPHLLTLDNEEAEIQVAEKRPFPSGLSLGGLGSLGGLAGAAPGAAGALGNLGGLGLGSLSFNREDVGLTLKLKPQIHDEEFVRLHIDQELSDVAGIDAVTGQTITSKRKVKSTVVVRSQDSVVIGGLVRDRQSVDESKTPLFGDLPLIGWLFKRQVKVAEKVNLMLVLTPYIIRNPQDFRVIFERKMAERKDFADRFYGLIDDFKPEIDWSRKRGPMANYRLGIRKEMTKAENEGPGTDDQTVIRPDSSSDKKGQRKKDESRPLEKLPERPERREPPPGSPPVEPPPAPPETQPMSPPETQPIPPPAAPNPPGM